MKGDITFTIIDSVLVLAPENLGLENFSINSAVQ